MDSIDRLIVALLIEDARRTFADIGAQVRLSAPAVKRRVDKLEDEGVIRGYTAILGAEGRAWKTEAFVELFASDRTSVDQIRESVRDHPEVVAAYTVTGDADAVLHLRAADTEHLEEALERIRLSQHVVRTRTQLVLTTLLERDVHGPASPMIDHDPGALST